MLQFILTNLLLISVGGILYIFVRALPRIGEREAKEEKRTVFERWVMSEIPHQIDRALNATLGKLFRKLKVLLLRFDNYLTSRLKKIHTETNGNGSGITGTGAKPKIDFSDLGGASGGKDVEADSAENV